MKSQKQKALEAIDELIKRYSTGKTWVNWGDGASCPLCQIYLLKNKDMDSCRGCPMANKEGGHGCIIHKTWMDLQDAYVGIWGEFETPLIFTRAKALKKFKKLIENEPAKKFTVKGWTFFKQNKKFY
jgi:hypothetical protein